ncbi:MAG: hypothetical protein LBQ15_09485 [Clostridium sp.]|jgi:ABC-type transport system involved in multi-copper enzyme maturation permease subunit|nr:hypothetical protein [Clostridium sp.]
MFPYLRGEIYRLLCKKSLYLYFGAFALAYLLLMFIRMGSSGAEQMLTDAETLFGFLPPVIGGYLFAAIYTDDLNARNLATLIGFGMNKAQIILSKLLLMALFGTVMVGLVPLFMYAAYAVLGTPASFAILGEVSVWGLKALMEILAFASLSAAVVYGLQRATFGMVTYLLLALGIVSQLLEALLNWDMVSGLLPGLSRHLMAGILLRTLVGILTGESVLLPASEYVVYVAVTVVLSSLAFHKKELEF